MKQYLLNLVAASVGVPIAPELAEAIVAAGLGLAGLVGMLTADQ